MDIHGHDILQFPKFAWLVGCQRMDLLQAEETTKSDLSGTSHGWSVVWDKNYPPEIFANNFMNSKQTSSESICLANLK
jgi:hypothetical protein